MEVTRPTNLFGKRREKMTVKMQDFKNANSMSYAEMAQCLRISYSKCYAWARGINGPQPPKEFDLVSRRIR